MKNKIITIEGTDCSGKQVQTELLVKRLLELGIGAKRFSFPNYESPTGKIIGQCYLGKPAMGKSFFEEGAKNVSPQVSSALYAIDRCYNKQKMLDILKEGNLVLDRYIDSNMGHQAGKLANKKDRKAMYRWIEKLEYGMFKMPKSNIKVLLYVPFEVGEILRHNRQEALDDLEKDAEHLQLAEKAYLEIAKRNHYKIIYCAKDNKMRTIEDIHNELFDYVIKRIKRG